MDYTLPVMRGAMRYLIDRALGMSAIGPLGAEDTTLPCQPRPALSNANLYRVSASTWLHSTISSISV